MMDTVELRRDVPIRCKPDVMVAGGGPAGIAAAITAARQGASVFLAEGQACLGGMGTAGMLPIFMAFGDSLNFYAGGFGRELYDRLESADATTLERPWGLQLPVIRVEGLKRLYDEMALEAGVELSLMTQVIGVEAHDGRVSAVICGAKSGIFAVAPRVVIDCTGDGDVCAWGGAPFEKGDDDGQMMGATLCSLWADVDWPAVDAARQSAEDTLVEALRRDPQVLLHTDPHLPGILPVGTSTGGGNVGHSYGVDGTDERSLSEALVFARRLLPYYERFYNAHMKGYERARLVTTASLMGVRESRRILGEYVLTYDDYKTNATFDDEIGRFNYWIDTHLSAPDLAAFEAHMALRREERKPGDSYGIPYRTLTPRGSSNMLVAGRCISTDRAVQSSIRVMPGCFITGQAAGMAAAIAATNDIDTRGVPIEDLQTRLASMGAFLPNLKPAQSDHA